MELRFKVSVIPLIFLIVLCPSLFSFTNNIEASNQPANLNPFLEKFIARHAAQIGESQQLIFAVNMDASSFRVTVHSFEKKNGAWRPEFPAFVGSIGKKGFAAMGEKREGDGKTPSGIFPLGIAFGYDASVATKMPYRQATE